MKVYNDPIPVERIHQFIEILNATGGRFTSNPMFCKREGVYRCDYTPGDYEAMCKAWRMVTEDIKEIRKDQWYRIAWRRVRLFKIK